MFYIGFRNNDFAQIGMVWPKDGINRGERFKENPIISPTKGTWDESDTCKPFALISPDRFQGNRIKIKCVNIL